jgi:hypothetical protein
VGHRAADDKQNAGLIVSQIVVDALEGLKAQYPKVSSERIEQLRSIREELISGAK